MKKLIVTMKSTREVLADFKKAFRKAQIGKLAGQHYEVSFESKRDFDRFVKNMGILAIIYKRRPRSVYELAKVAGMDVSNLNKLMDFFAEVGAIKLKASSVNGRKVRTPVVEYGRIEFDLKRAG